jgi:osmoprotectant transport system permease protein
MRFLRDVASWFADGKHWSGSAGIPARALEHVEISLLSVGVAMAVAVPLALYIGHTRRFQFLVVSLANLGRAIPSFAILVAVTPFTIRWGLGIGLWPTVIALVLLGIPPILTNTYIGVQGVDPDTLEAARGMGMSEWDLLVRVEIPLGIPLIVAGIRTAAVQVVATATLAALIAWGGLGRFIVDGIAIGEAGYPQVFAGAVLVATLAVIIEVVFALTERLVSPRTSSRRRRPVVAALSEPGPNA